MNQFNLNPKLLVLTQRLIKDELATPVAIGEVSNPNPQLIGCVMPISEEQSLVVLDDGSISAIQPSITPDSKRKFSESYGNITKEAIIFENIDRVQHILYFGLGADIDVILRNDRVADSEKIKNLIALAAQKVHENNQFREKVKEDSINFLLEKFKLDESQPILPAIETTLASSIPQMEQQKDSNDSEEELNLSDLAKQHSGVIQAINQQPSILTASAPTLPPLN